MLAAVDRLILRADFLCHHQFDVSHLLVSVDGDVCLPLIFNILSFNSALQGMMDPVLACLPFIFVYLDDDLVASPDHTSHKQHLHKVLCRLHENSQTINPLKSVFDQEKRCPETAMPG